VLHDLRLALRRLRKNPLFASTAIGTLALGIGATTAIYTVVDGVLLKPLPFPHPEALVRVTADYEGIGLQNVGISQPELEMFAERSGAFENLAGTWPISANLTGTDRPERVEVLLTSHNYFELLGIPAALGRTYTKRDEIPGIAPVAVISDGLWRRGFGGDPHVLGRTIRVDEDAYEIVGVMPPTFRHPSVTVETDVHVWALCGWKAAPFPPPAYSARFIASAVGRLKPGGSADEARARLAGLARELARDHQDDYPERLGWKPQITPLGDDLVRGVRPALLIVMGAIGVVLLIAVTNISTLLLVGAAARERDIAVERALGAGGWRIVRGLLAEGLLLAAAGGTAGFILTFWAVDALLRFAPERLPRLTDVAVDYRVLLFTLAVIGAAGVVVGLAPALQSARTDDISRLKDVTRTTLGGRRARRIRSALVVGEIALAIVLLAAAGLLARSLRNAQQVDIGISTDRLLTARLWLPQPNEPSSGPYFEHAARVTLIRSIVDRLAASPSIAHAGMATNLPLSADSGTATFAAEGWTSDRRDLATATPSSVTPEYFKALGVQLIRGRLLEDADDARHERAVVINQALAKAYFPGEDAVGRRIRFVGRRGQVSPNAPWLKIVGVVRDVKEDGVEAATRPQIYQSLWQVSSLALTMAIAGNERTPASEDVATAVRQIDPNLPLFAVRTGNELLALGLAQRRFATTLINAFAAVALFLCALGVHGVIAYSVRQQTREIGVRVALGASASQVIRLFLLQSVRLGLPGIAIGAIAALLAARLVSSQLFNVSSRDPWTLIAVVVLLAVTVVATTLAAARRATRIDPASALRAE
jgi:putative ABC transport system permease protein